MVSLGRSDDLFHDFNQELKRRIEGPIKSVNVVLGPPISGKCFFATHYLGSDVLGSIIGFISLKPTKACSEYKSVEEIVEETKEVKNEEEIIEKIVKFLVNVVFPGGVKRFINTVSIDKATEMLKDAGFSDFEIEVFSDYFKGVGRVSRQLIEQLTLLKKSYGSLIIYWIPWDVDEKYSLDGDVKKAVELIKKHFRNGIRWLGVKYIPPGLVAEVVRRIREEGLDKAEEYVKSQAKAYYGAVKLLVSGGERDFEVEGLIASGVMNFLEQLATSGISSVLSTILSGVASLVMGSAAVALALIAIYQLTRESTKHSPGEFIELMRHWATLHPSLRKIIASKIAIQLGITPSEAEDAINQVTRLSEEQLRQLVEVVQNRLRELEKRVERLEGNVRLLESQVKGFVIYRLGDIADGKLYPNIELVGNDLGVVSETYGRVEVNIVRAGEFDKYLNQVIDGLKNGLVVLTGPKGIGKSTLALYGIWELLRSGGYYGVVKLENIGNDDVRLAIENFLETYKRDFINSFGKLVLLYDPSTATAYASLGVAINVRDVEVTLRQLMKLADRLSELEASLIIVMPSDLYNGLGDKDVKEFLNKHSINVNLRSSEFIKAIIKAYAGCSISEDVLNTITSEVLKFNEGYTLIARIIGEGLRRSNCLVADIQAMLREAHGDASAFLIRWINGYLRGIPIDRVSEVLTIREQFKNEVGPGDYVATPTLIEKLLTIGSKVKEEEEVSLIEERANWLAVRHEDLLEDAITRIVKTAMGETVTGSEHLIKALKPWSKYGKFKGKINEVSDAVKYINERYGKELGEEFKNISSDCWNAIVLALGTTWNVRSLKAVIEGFEGVTGLMPIVNSALRTIRSVNCDAVRLMIINNEIPPLTRELLGVIAKSPGNFVLDALAKGNVDHVRNAFNEFIKVVKGGRKENKKLHLIELIYALGLAILTAYAVKRGIEGGYVSDDWLKAKALEVAKWAIWHITDPSLIIAAVNLMSNLSNSSLNDWAVILATATNALIDNENELSKLSEFIDDLWTKRNKLSDWGKAYLIRAMANTLRAKKNAEQVCTTFNKILNTINEIRSDPLKVLSSAIAYSRLASAGVDCSVYLNIDLRQEIKKLIETLKSADQASWLRDEQLKEYLRHYGLAEPEDALRRLINESLSGLYYTMGRLSIIEGKLDDVLENFEKAKNISKSLENWDNYITSYSKLVRAKVLKARNINELIDVSKEFEEVFNEAVERLPLTAAGLTTLVELLAEYLVYLAIVGDKIKLTELTRNYGLFPQYLPPNYVVVTALFLKWLGADVKVLNAKELINMIRRSLDPVYMLALRRVLGINVNCSKECGELDDPNDAKICKMACAAAGGDKHALEELMEYIRGIKPDLADALANFSPRAIVQALAPNDSLGSLALILNALINNDYESAKAIAMAGEYLYNKPIIKELFGDLRRAVDEEDVDGIKLALTKLYYFHV